MLLKNRDFSGCSDSALLNDLRVLCGPLRLCVEYWLLKEQDSILNAKSQRTAKHAKD